MGDGVRSARRVPRTDAVLADPRLAAAAATARPRPGQGRGRRGPAAGPRRRDRPRPRSPTPRSPRCPATATPCAPVLNATGVRAAHQPRPGAAVRRRASRRWSPRPGTPTSSSTSTTGRRARRGPGRAGRAAPPRCPHAGAVHVVNNGAAALVLAATALAAGREIVRQPRRAGRDRRRVPPPRPAGQSTGARLREVGTTNRTTRADYAAAIGPDTGFVLKVHPSQLPGHRVHLAPSPSASWPRSACRWSPTSAPGCSRPHPLLPDEPDAATALRARRRPGHRQRRQAARRPAGRAAARRRRRWSSGCAGTRWPGRCGSTSSPSPRWRPPCAGRATPTAAGAARRPGRAARRAPSGCADGSARDGVDGRGRASAAVVGGGGAPGVGWPAAARQPARAVRRAAARRRARRCSAGSSAAAACSTCAASAEPTTRCATPCRGRGR